ncbi:MAG TPA: isoprenylcysteine carboxylmethyltransferase family protein [Candidatus Eisenbacteria bacterium]|nr:isoprenylcysteine carboxylmethyltransferase family protein [Candidatus Eisenbacteria bacterium]
MIGIPFSLAPALALVVGLLAATRVRELRVSARNERAMRARGGHEVPGSRFALFALLHALVPLGMLAEVVACGARPGPLWPLWAVLLALAEGVRAASMRALGDRWSARIFVVPGEPRVRRGLYRRLAHPNYLGVVLELAALPLLFGAWRTAIAGSLVNAILLADRVRAEDRALAEAERAPFDRAARSE